MSGFVIEFPAPDWPWSINDERAHHWSWRNERVRLWRQSAFVCGNQMNVGQLPPSNVHCVLPANGNARRDPSNYLPAVKAIIDGFVDAGFWPDDNGDWVTVLEPTLDGSRREPLRKIPGVRAKTFRPGKVTVSIARRGRS